MLDVRVVNVEVVVTDREGYRVQGLHAGDFELLVDGEPVPIEYFTEIDEGVVRAPREEQAGDGGLQAVPSLTPDTPVSTYYLLFIDEFFAIKRDRDRVLKRLERDLAKLGPHDRMAVVAFDGRNVARLTDWTGTRDELRDAFREARERAALGLMRRTDIDPAATAPDPLVAAAPGSPAPNALAETESVPSLGDVRRAATALILNKRERQILRSVLAATAGLHASDFELLVDGEPVPIDWFTEVDEGHAVARDGNGVGNAPSLTLGEPLATNYLLFIDELFAIRRQRDGFLNRLERDLALLNPSDQVAIVAFDGYAVTRLTDWTNSRDQIGNAIQRARERKALGLMRMLDLGDRTDQVRRTVMAATASIRSLADVPGRRVMLLLVETFCSPSRSWEFSSFWEDGSCREDVGDMYQPLARKFHGGFEIGSHPADNPSVSKHLDRLRSETRDDRVYSVAA